MWAVGPRSAAQTGTTRYCRLGGKFQIAQLVSKEIHSFRLWFEINKERNKKLIEKLFVYPRAGS